MPGKTSLGLRLLCLAHITNTTGQSDEHFEKGEADGTTDALAVFATVVEALTADWN